MSTTYNTLRLPEPEKKRSKAVYLVVGALIVAAALAAAVTVGSPQETTDTYYASRSDPVTCDKRAPGYRQALPKYDPQFSGTPAFYNACYYSYRCCTTVGNSNGCYVSNNFGTSCEKCISKNAPRMVRGVCSEYLQDFRGKEAGVVPAWGKAALFADSGFPKTKSKSYQVRFGAAKVKTCWTQAGPNDKRTKLFQKKCFEVISFCNLLCPRDTPEQTDHVMCKHCMKYQGGYYMDQQLQAGVKVAASQALLSDAKSALAAAKAAALAKLGA